MENENLDPAIPGPPTTAIIGGYRLLYPHPLNRDAFRLDTASNQEFLHRHGPFL